MSPEYAIDGIFSVKSDVFSFGVLVLEIVSGKRNRGFIHPDHSHNLPGHVSVVSREIRVHFNWFAWKIMVPWKLIPGQLVRFRIKRCPLLG